MSLAAGAFCRVKPSETPWFWYYQIGKPVKALFRARRMQDTPENT
jgi:hypothetical protein